MNEFLAKLKRLFQPSPRPTESLREATEDRPPPPVIEPPPIEPASTPVREQATVDADDLAEIRAALEAVADPPIAPAEPELAEPDPEPLEAETDSPELLPEATGDVTDEAPTPALESITPIAAPAASAPERVDAPAQRAARAGDALVLTLGTPPVTFTVTKTTATLGRGQENTIRLDDLSVSRRHARIAFRQGGYWLSDLGSMGGTWVNGTRLSAPRRLAAGEVIDIGLLRLTVGFAGGSASADARATAETKKSAKTRSEAAGQVRRRR